MSSTKTLTADHFSSNMNIDTKTTSSELHLFVRMIPKCNTLVIHVSKQDTVKSLLKIISIKTKIPIKYQRLIYKGKQLQREQNLRELCIENYETLYLMGHLMSIGCPVMWKDTDDVVSLILRLGNCEWISTVYAFELIKDHLTMYMEDSNYINVFMTMKIPSLLVHLYTSSHENIKKIVDFSVKLFVNICVEMKCEELQGSYIEVVFEFCELLRGVGCDDSLYDACRDGFVLLLKIFGGFRFTSPKWKVLIQGVFVCVCELADELLSYLDLCKDWAKSNGLSGRVARNFVTFSIPLRMGIAEHQDSFNGYEDCGFCYKEDDPIAIIVDQFRIVFIQLLRKMDECLQGMEDCLGNKEPGEMDWDGIHNGWSHYLLILKELYHISKFYSGAEEMFWGVLLHRKNMLSHLIVHYADRNDDNRWILENKSVTDFESRRNLILLLFPDMEDVFLGYEMLIDRSQLLAESFEYITRAKADNLKGGLFMEFKNEEATGPGVIREWFVLVCQEIFNPKNALFVACPNDRRRFFPNATSKVHPLHLKYFSFTGRIIALALKNKVHVGIALDRVFYNQLAGNFITLEDIRDADPIMYRSCKQILEIDADYIDSDALGLTFSIEVEELGHKKVIELCPGGEHLVVDSKNRKKYVDLLIKNRFVTSISEQVSHFAEGFADIISCSRLEFFRYLDLEDLNWMLHGSENAISVEDWKAHTMYKGYKKIDCQISWFWEIIGKMSVEQRKVLLFFWTSVKHLPVEGFRGLDSRLYICKTMEPDNHLPSSHTCFYELCFPPYASMTIMQDRLEIITDEHFSSSFGTS